MASFLSKSFLSQSFNIPRPSLTEGNLPDQTGRVVIITGGYAGVGQELSRILYQKNAIVYVAGRSTDKATKSISYTKALFPKSKGRIEFLLLDLADLSKIKKAALEFMEREKRLDVLVNNAGVMFPPAGSKSAQGHELQMATNVLGHFLFTESLLPVLKSTATSSPASSVRVTWAGSLGIQVYAPENGVEFDSLSQPVQLATQKLNYGQSKAANLFISTEFARRYAKDGIVSVCFNPGNLKTELQRHSSGIDVLMGKMALYPAIFGAYTELYSGWSDEITMEKNGLYVIPWGRDGMWSLRKGVAQHLKEGETGAVKMLWAWCEKETQMFR